MSNNGNPPIIDWVQVMGAVQKLIRMALEEYKLPAANIIGVIPSGSLPGTPLPPEDGGDGTPPTGGYPPVAATAEVMGGIKLTNDLGGTADKPSVVGFYNIPLAPIPSVIPDKAVFAYDSATHTMKLVDPATLVIGSGAVSPYHIAYTNSGSIVHRNDGTVVTVRTV